MEDPPLITGRGRFIADVTMVGEVHMRVVRSPVAHARVTEIETAEALAFPGVVAIWTAADVVDVPPIDFRQEGLTDLYPYRQPVLASGKVRYVGEPVAVVFAEDPYVAEDAAELVFVDFEDLDVVMDPTVTPGVFEGSYSTEAAVVNISYGDVEGSFATASRVIGIELAVGRHTGVPMETRGALAVRGNDGRITMHGAAKVPHYNRQAIAKMLGLGIDDVILREGHVGGGFGVRGELYPEDVLVCRAALKLRRPVKWIEDRREHLIATNHSRDQIHRIEAALDADGFITAIRDEFWLDQGAYIRTHAATVPNLTAAMLPGPYVIPAYECKGHIRLTNKTPAGTYRAPGRYEATFARERLIDAIANDLGEDANDTRRRNFIRADAMPFARPIKALGTELEYDSGDYHSILDKSLSHVEAKGLRDELIERRRAGEFIGIGTAFFVEKSGLGPYEGVRVEVDDSGAVRIVTGAASVGQGIETTIAQVCGEVLRVPLDRIRVVHGQTDEIDHGLGAFASRVTVMVGTATHMAAEAVVQQAREAAAHLLEADLEDIVVADGAFGVAGAPSRSVSLAQVARALNPSSARASELAPSLAGEAWFMTDHMTYPYGVHTALVRVDEETGAIEIPRFVVAYDIGKAVNPMLVEGQIVGGAAQGLGGALLEEFAYSSDGQPLATSFMDYLLPTVSEMPPVDVLLLEDAPSPLNPLGLKGAGEGGTTAFGAAVASGVDDALGIPGAVRRLPVSPERVKHLVRYSRERTVRKGR